MDDANPGLRILDLRDRVMAHPGRRIVEAIQGLDSPVGLILFHNALELRKHLATFPHDADGVMLFDAFDHSRMDRYLGEALRLTHNLVASVGTVIDQTRRVQRQVWPAENHPIRVAFARDVGKFNNDGRLRLVRDLRNFFLHRSLPQVIGRLSVVEQVGETAAVEFSTANLLEWDGWRAAARAHLEAAAEAIPLDPPSGVLHQ